MKVGVVRKLVAMVAAAGGSAECFRVRGRHVSRYGEKMASQLQEKLQAEVTKYQQIQKDISTSMAARQKLEAQVTENKIVKEELGVLDDSNTVYKLIGPVLVKQDLEEAKSTVEKRLQYINGEIKRYETMLKDLEQKSDQQRASLTKLQQEYQRTQIKGPVKA
ncbi:prefoldin subunit 6 [Lithobates pipiens]